MKEYKSNEEFFQAFERLVLRIHDSGQTRAADCLRKGFSCLNGLTDGWALLMESIETTLSEDEAGLTPEDTAELEEMFTVVKKVVCRT